MGDGVRRRDPCRRTRRGGGGGFRMRIFEGTDGCLRTCVRRRVGEPSRDREGAVRRRMMAASLRARVWTDRSHPASEDRIRHGGPRGASKANEVPFSLSDMSLALFINACQHPTYVDSSV